jgi:hypothetical protein
MIRIDAEAQADLTHALPNLQCQRQFTYCALGAEKGKGTAEGEPTNGVGSAIRPNHCRMHARENTRANSIPERGNENAVNDAKPEGCGRDEDGGVDKVDPAHDEKWLRSGELRSTDSDT